MNMLDSLALWGRRVEQQTVLGTSRTRFDLADLLTMFDRSAILELVPVVEGKALPAARPDMSRKVKVSLLDDGISAIHSGSADWYEVYRTAPSGDLSRVRIVAHSADGSAAGELRMLVGRRAYDQYFAEDPVFDHIQRYSQAADSDR
jgi:hypothetical protein